MKTLIIILSLMIAANASAKKICGTVAAANGNQIIIAGADKGKAANFVLELLPVLNETKVEVEFEKRQAAQMVGLKDWFYCAFVEPQLDHPEQGDNKIVRTEVSWIGEAPMPELQLPTVAVSLEKPRDTRAPLVAIAMAEQDLARPASIKKKKAQSRAQSQGVFGW